MATGGYDSLSKSDLESNFLSCSLCLEQYQEPRTLECLHSFCESCLIQYAVENGCIPGKDLLCPLCRTITKMPDGGVQELRINFVLKGLADWAENTKSTTPCQSDCTEKQSCEEMPTLLMCEIHHQKCELYCKTGFCKKLICTKCVPSHSGHLLTTVEEHCEVFLKSQADIELRKEIVKEVLENLQERMHEVDTLEADLKSQITKQLEVLLLRATAKADALRFEVLQALEPERQAVRSNIQKLEGHLKSLSHTHDVLEQVVKMGATEACWSMGLLASKRATQLMEDKVTEMAELTWERPRYMCPDLAPPLCLVQIDQWLGCIERESQHLSDIKCNFRKTPISGAGSASAITPDECSLSHLPSTPNRTINKNTQGASSMSPSTAKKNQMINKFGFRIVNDLMKPRITDICFGPDGTLVLLDSQNCRVKMFGVDGKLKWATEYRFPSELQSVVWYSLCQSYLLAVRKNGFYLVDQIGNVTRSLNIMKEAHDPFSVLVSAYGELVTLGYQPRGAASEYRLSVWDPEGAMCLRCWKVSDKNVYATLVDNIIVLSATEEHRIQAYTLSGQKLWGYGGKGRQSTQLNGPEGVCASKMLFTDGRYSGDTVEIFITDRKNNRIHVLNSNGEIKMHLSKGIKKPILIEADSRGHLAILNASHGREEVQIWQYVPKFM